MSRERELLQKLRGYVHWVSQGKATLLSKDKEMLDAIDAVLSQPEAEHKKFPFVWECDICDEAFMTAWQLQHHACKEPAPQQHAAVARHKGETPETDAPYVMAAFINVIAEEGTKEEAINYLQTTWSECCKLRAENERLRNQLEKEK